MARLERAKIPVFSYRHAGLADITTTMRNLGARIGRGKEADAVAAGIERDIDAIRRVWPGRPRPKTALVLRPRAWHAAQHLRQRRRRLHARHARRSPAATDVFDDVKRQSLQATTEILLARAPEVIIEAHATDGWTAERAGARAPGLAGAAVGAGGPHRPRVSARRRPTVDSGPARRRDRALPLHSPDVLHPEGSAKHDEGPPLLVVRQGLGVGPARAQSDPPSRSARC